FGLTLLDLAGASGLLALVHLALERGEPLEDLHRRAAFRALEGVEVPVPRERPLGVGHALYQPPDEGIHDGTSSNPAGATLALSMRRLVLALALVLGCKNPEQAAQA